MALVRCSYCGVPQGRARRYVKKPVHPEAYPNPAVICGGKNCLEEGLVWLDESEWRAYQHGQCIFLFPSNAAKIKVEKFQG